MTFCLRQGPSTALASGGQALVSSTRYPPDAPYRVLDSDSTYPVSGLLAEGLSTGSKR